MKLDENGLNAALTASFLPSRQDMRILGFIDGSDCSWRLNRPLGQGITLNLSIPKNGGRFCLDIIDEHCLEPYDYQSILVNQPNHEFALEVRMKVEKIFEFLSKVRIIHGFQKGMYI